MVLVDTSVWISHFRGTHDDLVELLTDGQVACHPFIVGELACGNLKNRTVILSLLEALPMSLQVEHEEALAFIEHHDLMGKGLGYIDVHLIASAVLTGFALWTFDKRLDVVADMFHHKYQKKNRY